MERVQGGGPVRDPLDIRERTLSGLTIVVTRTEDRNPLAQTALERLGAATLSIPSIRFAPPDDTGPLRSALDRIRLEGSAAYQWVLFTSSTGVKFFFDEARDVGVPEATWSDFRFAAVGPTTASRLASAGVKAGRVVIGSRADTLGRILIGEHGESEVTAGQRCLLPQADIARGDLQDILRARGVEVDCVVAYRTLPEDREKARPFLDALAERRRIDGITFASPSAFENFLAMTDPDGPRAMREQPIPIFSIGPTTSQAICNRGFTVAAQASPFTSSGLIQAIVDYFTSRSERDEEREADARSGDDGP